MGTRTRTVVAWKDTSRSRIDPIKALVTCLVGLGAWVVVLLCVDVWEHDMTLIESVKNTPRQMLANVGALMGMAWQYKLGAVLVIAVVATIFYIRRVPTIRSRS